MGQGHANLASKGQYYPFSTGRPSEHVFQTVGTGHVAPSNRYEYWSETHIRHITMDAPRPSQRRDFRGQLSSLASPTMEIHYAEFDAFSATRTLRDVRTDPSDELALLLLLDGTLHASLDDRCLTLGRNNLYLYDSSRPQRLEFSRNRLVQFDIDRQKLAAACGGRAPQPALVIEALKRSGLTPMLRRHLSEFPASYRHLTPQECVVMQAATETLALTVISAAVLSNGAETATGLQLAEAARHYIHANLDKPELDAADIAHHLGCSRATLYRAFGLTGASVAAYIRERRLLKLRQMLRNPLERRPVAALATLCGLYDTPNVSQMFRRRFGMSPTEARRLETKTALF